MTRSLPHFMGLSIGLHLMMAGLWQNVPVLSLGIPHDALRVTLEEAQSQGSQYTTVAPAARAAPQSKSQSPQISRKSPDRASVRRSRHDHGDRQPVLAPKVPMAEREKTRAAHEVAANMSVDGKAADPAPLITPRSGNTSPPTAGSQNQAHAGRISAAVKKRLAAYFEYPFMARRRGWEGEVLLSVHLDPNGSMSNIEVTQSSGYGVLDRAALKSAKKAKGVPAVIGWLAGRHFDMVVPIHYQLIDS